MLKESNLSKILTYGATFVIGYYIGGGCDEIKVERYDERIRFERKLKESEMQIKDLEDRIKIQDKIKEQK